MTISILDDDFSSLNQYIKETKPSQILILVDTNTHTHCLPTFLGNLETEIPFEIIEIEAGEDLKNLETAAQLWEIFAEFGADRQALLVNLGGGVISDLGGFVASTYKRGIKFINVPTTLLAMCDASIGGKTGIDHHFLKNIVGTFTEATPIFVYPDFLKTLPFTELRSGFAEMLKHGLIADKNHWEQLIAIEQLDVENLSPHIKTSMNIKKRIVEEDFKEQNIRKMLNFGHTIGHAIESLFLKNSVIVPHGECVAMGMICETYLAFLEGFLSEQTAENIITNINHFYPKLNINDFSNEEILYLMLNDKKNNSGTIRFSLLDNLGKGNFDVSCQNENIVKAIEFYKNSI